MAAHVVFKASVIFHALFYTPLPAFILNIFYIIIEIDIAKSEAL